MPTSSPQTLAEAVATRHFEVVVTDVGFRGEGFVRFEDGWLSIPGALRGERVEVVIDDATTHRRRAWGRVVRVVGQPSNDRGDAQCEAAGWCRGCHLRHMTRPAEHTFKAQSVAECVEKFGGIERSCQPDVDVVSADLGRADGVRRRANLAVDATGKLTLGLRSGSQLVPMRSCPALAPELRELIEEVEKALAFADSEALGAVNSVRLESGAQSGRVEVVASAEANGIVTTLQAGLRGDLELVFSTPSLSEVVRPREVLVEHAGLRLEVGPNDWSHATTRPAEALYARVEEFVAGAESVLDAGCGVGTVGLLAARRGAKEVVGFDASYESVQTAARNADRNGLNVEFFAARWEKGLRRLAAQGLTFERALLNTMREPVGEQALRFLAALRVQRLLYLGPSPTAASKDLAHLVGCGWRLKSLAGVDLHPGTYHVMLAGELECP